jgi:hypothetical protein
MLETYRESETQIDVRLAMHVLTLYGSPTTTFKVYDHSKQKADGACKLNYAVIQICV